MKYIILITLFLFSLNLQAETEDRPVLKYNVVKSNTSLNNNCIIRGKKINKAKLKIYLAPEDNHRTIIQNDDIETIFIKLALCISKPFRTHKNIYLPQLVFQHTNELEVSQKLNLTPFLGAKSHVQFQRTPKIQCAHGPTNLRAQNVSAIKFISVLCNFHHSHRLQ